MLVHVSGTPTLLFCAYGINNQIRRIRQAEIPTMSYGIGLDGAYLDVFQHILLLPRNRIIKFASDSSLSFKYFLFIMKHIFIFLLFIISSATSVAETTKIEEIARMREIADSLHNIGRTDSAVVVGERAIHLATEAGDPIQMVGTHAAQGVFLRSLGKIDEALKSYEKALAIVTSGKFRENPNQEAIEEIASLYINLAVLHLDTQHKELAAKHAEQSGEWISKSADPELRSTIYGVIGSVMTACGNLEKALHYQSLAYRDAIASKNNEAAFRSAAYTMLISDRLGNKKEAQEWREKCEELMPEIESMMAKLVYYQAECSICLTNGDPKGSIKWFKTILDMDGIENLPFVKFDCYNNLHIAYAETGDYKAAYNTLLEGNVLRDSLWAQEKSESLRDLTVKYETKETELALAQSETKRATTLMWLFAVGGMLLVAIIIFVLYVNRQRRVRMQKEIEFANLRADIGQQLTQQYIDGLENERQRMSRELHDGVCNDLLAIEMNINGGKPIESTVGLISSCREAVRRISHELMPPEFAYANIDEVVRFYVNKQAEANSGKTAVRYTSFIKDADWCSVPDRIALEIYRIIQEAVGNAIKHSGANEITVDLTLDGSNLTATVIDNGFYKGGKNKGIGIESIRKRANSIKAELTFEALANKGTMVRLGVKI